MDRERGGIEGELEEQGREGEGERCYGLMYRWREK